MLLGNIDSKLPENYFMKWFRERMKEGRINLRFKASGERYLSDFIKKDDIDEWRPEMPVFISAQTGAGKNWFIQQILMYNLSESNHTNGTNEKILLLSNRVAANRQAKLQLMELLPDYEANNTMRLKAIYSAEGLDEALKQLHNVYIYSYKQFLSAENLGRENFKYVVCDECHYFTSDAHFATETQQVLQKIIHECSNAIHIYMSATPDVAFEPILRTEYARIQQVIDALSEAKENRLSIVPQVNIDQINTAIRGMKTVEDFPQSYQAQKRAEWEEVNHAYDQEIASKHLDVLFYYMERNFDYIRNLFFYQNEEELTARILQSLKNSEEKWLIFTRTKSEGRELCEKIKTEFSKAYPDDSKDKNSVPIAIFIDADSRNKYGMEADEFQYIVENESFRPSVLIATSTLDNGVNIKDENVKNVVIDFLGLVPFFFTDRNSSLKNRNSDPKFP
ncbi:MAG: DEAD/DEAH box helicase family protein [Selenomonadaceae bacterium]|nr:DEAD/DEAH box helicase family protein [Selenomonadaceae bacterium]